MHSEYESWFCIVLSFFKVHLRTINLAPLCDAEDVDPAEGTDGDVDDSEALRHEHKVDGLRWHPEETAFLKCDKY